jgi:N-acetylglucosamine-6-phosphate deacetylase
VKKPDAEMLERLIEASGQLVKLVTIAPEVQGAVECIRSMKEKVHFSAGHTMAGCEEAAAAFAEGADHVTHLYNAMPGLSHRNPGVVGAAADNPKVMAELICDGIHIHPVAVRAAFTLFGAERMILISDSTRACGMPDGTYELGGIPVYKKDGAVRQEDGTLAGSAVNVYDCMVNAIRMGIPEETAIRAVTYNPLKSIGMLEERGTITIGKKAHILLTDSSYALKRIIA